MPSIEENLHTIAVNSDRIASALEAIVPLMASPITTQVTNVVAEATPAADAVKATAGRVASGKEKAKDTKPAPPPPPPPAPPAKEEEVDPLDDTPAKQYTVDDVRAALKVYRDVEGSAAMLDVLKQHGAETLGALDESKYAAVMAAVSK